MLPSILVVDDDDIDVRAIKRSLSRQGVANPVAVARDGAEALEALRGDPANGRLPLDAPYVVLLDLNMPRMGGLEFLRELRADPELQSTVVFVLSTSDSPTDRAEAYRHHVAGYLLKTTNKHDFENVADLLSRYVKAVRLPTRPARED